MKRRPTSLVVREIHFKILIRSTDTLTRMACQIILSIYEYVEQLELAYLVGRNAK